MKIYVIHGPNLNLLGLREPEIYGKKTYEDLVQYIEETANALGIATEFFQSNHEGDLVDFIQNAYGNADGIIINPAAYTHTSIAILDAAKAVGLPLVEVHLSDIYQREDYRHISYIAEAAIVSIYGKGFAGYQEALKQLKAVLEKEHS